MNTLKTLMNILLISLLTGCSSMLVPTTNDPEKKLSYAIMLTDQQLRPLPAENLINESISIYTQNDNEAGLAEAYRVYGFFFRSPAVEKWKSHYKSNGFIDKTATYDTRLHKSIEYFEKAGQIYNEKEQCDLLVNIYLNMGFTYEFAGMNKKACEAYKTSLLFSDKFIAKNPGRKQEIPDGFDTYEDFINGFLTRLGCD